MGFNNKKLLKHLPPSIVTALGNIYQEINNHKSTKKNIKMISPVTSELENGQDKCFYLVMENSKTHELLVKLIPFDTIRFFKVFLRPTILSNCTENDE